MPGHDTGASAAVHEAGERRQRAGNSIVGEIRFHRDRMPSLVEAPDFAMGRSLSCTEIGYDFQVSLSTLTALSYRSRSRRLLIWGVEPLPVVRDALEEFVQALARNPASALDALAGCWGLVFADASDSRVILAADRAAQRPPCFHATADRLVFGISARDVSARTSDAPQVRAQAIFDYVRGHVISAPETVFADVFRLQSGEYADVVEGAVSHAFYWRPVYEGSEARRERFSDARTRLLVFLRDAVRKEIGPGKTGAFLSGGTDSSTMAGMLGAITEEAPNTYSIGFDAPGFDEMAYARIAARHFKANHHEYYLTPDDLLASMAEVAQAYDQPFGNSSALAAYYCARTAASDGIEKLLGGDGGDEIFGGNVRYAKQKLFHIYRHVPSSIDRTLVEWSLIRSPLVERLPLLRKLRSYVAQARTSMPARINSHNLVTYLGVHDMFTPGFLAHVDPAQAAGSEAAWYARCPSDALIDRMLHYDWKYTLADNDLPKVLTTADLAGVPTAFPMLDERLVEFANRLPPTWKVKGLRLRPFFKQSLADFLPREILKKKKHGFGLPFGYWLTRHPRLRRLAEQTLEGFGERGVVRKALLAEVLGNRVKEHAGYYGELVWVVMMLEFWLRCHAPGFAIDPGDNRRDRDPSPIDDGRGRRT